MAVLQLVLSLEVKCCRSGRVAGSGEKGHHITQYKPLSAAVVREGLTSSNIQ